MDPEAQLSRRERQIMDIIYAGGEVTSADIRRHLSDPPTRGALRVMLRALEDKGQITHTEKDNRYVYRAVHARKQVGTSAMRRVVDTFFGGSLQSALAAHLAQNDTNLSDEDLKRLVDLIQQTRKKGK